jgi:hypothetical protein
MFRNHQRLVDTQTSASKTSRAAFAASFQGRTATGHQPTCLCGESHRYEECVYLNPYIRPEGWTGDSALEQKVQDILKKSDKKKHQVDRMVRYQKRKFKDDTDTAKDATKDSPAPNQSKLSKSKPTNEPCTSVVHLMSMYLINVHLTSAHLTIGMYLIGVHLLAKHVLGIFFS